jgi:hypothetical protein
MDARLDVFAVMYKEPKWLGCAETLEKALELMCEAGTGSYFVSSQNGHKDFFEVSPNGVISLVLNL